MDAKSREQAQAKALEMAANLSNEALCIAWTITETQPVTEELALTRGWLMVELHKRLGDDLFDEWRVAVDDDGNGVSPLSYFERKAAAESATEDDVTVHIRQRIARKRGDGFYRVQYSSAENGSRTLCGAQPTDKDMGWGDARFAKNLAYVTCDDCKRLRQA